MATTAIPSSWPSGRTIIRTDLPEITEANVKDEMARVLPIHNVNAGQIAILQDYHKGWHTGIQNRVKTTRTDVDNKITVDYAWSFTRDIVGYFLGKAIQYTHRDGKFRAQMVKFNNALTAENNNLVNYQIAEDASICGVGYRGVFPEAAPRNGTSLKLLRLEPQDTFVVYPSDPTKPPVYAVTAYEGQTSIDGAETTIFYKVYTQSKLFLLKRTGMSAYSLLASAEDFTISDTKAISMGGYLPIIEYPNNMWHLGDWEVAVPLMDALDAVTSDGVNDIQQAVNSVLVAMGMELTEEQFKNLSVSGLLNVKDIPPGVTPVVQFINQAMDASVGVSMRDYLEATLRVIVGVPDRKTRSGGGGDTGDAVFMRDGWQDIDLVATAKEQYFIQAERDSLAAILYILETNDEVKSLVAHDIDIHFNRNKTANLQSKAQTYQTLTTGDAPLAPVDALDIVGLTNNAPDVILRSESYAKERAEKRIAEAKELNDPSNSDEGGKSNAGAGGTTE